MKINIKVKYFSFGFLTSLVIVLAILFFGIKHIKGLQKKEIKEHLIQEVTSLDVNIKNYESIELVNVKSISNNEIMKLSDKRFLLINFWATWCAPCIEEFPFFEKLISNDEISKLPIQFIFLNNEDINKQKKFIEKSKIRLNFGKVNDSLPDVFNHNSIPATYVFDSENKIVYFIKGAKNWNSKVIKQFLKQIQ